MQQILDRAMAGMALAVCLIGFVVATVVCALPWALVLAWLYYWAR